MNVSHSASSGGVSNPPSERENVEKDPSVVSGANKTENVAKASMPANQGNPQDFDMEIGRVSKMDSEKNQESSLDAEEESKAEENSNKESEEKEASDKPTQQSNNGSEVTGTSNNQTSKYPAPSKQKEWVTLAVTTSAAAAGILSVLGASFLVASLIGGITIFPFVAWIITGIVGGVSCGLLLGFRAPIAGGIDKLISKMGTVNNFV